MKGTYPFIPSNIEAFGVRWLVLSLGIWNQPDPIGADGSGNNLYQLEDGNAVGNLDPTGLEPLVLDPNTGEHIALSEFEKRYGASTAPSTATGPAPGPASQPASGGGRVATTTTVTLKDGTVATLNPDGTYTTQSGPVNRIPPAKAPVKPPTTQPTTQPSDETPGNQPAKPTAPTAPRTQSPTPQPLHTYEVRFWTNDAGVVTTCVINEYDENGQYISSVGIINGGGNGIEKTTRHTSILQGGPHLFK